MSNWILQFLYTPTNKQTLFACIQKGSLSYLVEDFFSESMLALNFVQVFHFGPTEMDERHREEVTCVFSDSLITSVLSQ